ncbi:MAG: hypothetical protein VW102_06260, partial [Poseidonia sp.]
EEERLRLEEEERQRLAEEERLRLEEEERQRLEAERLAEEARLQAELEAQAAEKQAYWDQHGQDLDEQAKVVPDLPTDGTPMVSDEPPSSFSLTTIVAGVVSLVGLGALALVFL